MKVGPYRQWQGFQKLRVEGQYRDGAKDGAWTFYDDMGGKEQQGKYRNGKREGVWARWLAAEAVELIMFKSDAELDEPVAPAFWKDISPEISDVDILCGKFQNALNILRHRSDSDADPRVERATGVVVGCRSAAAHRTASKQTDGEQRAELARRQRSDPMWLRYPMSAALCHASAVKSAALAEIAEEYRNAKIAGVVDRAKLYDLQGVVVEQNDNIASVRRSMSRRRVPPAGCSDKTVHRLMICYLQTDVTLPEYCRDSDVTSYLDVLTDVLD